MSNTKTLAMFAVIMAATLVVGTFATTTTIATTGQSAFAYSQKQKRGGEDNGKGNGNGNTVTIEECKNRGSASGFDTALDQECENLICTHPGENATCVEEGAVVALPTSTPVTPVKLTCEQCFTTILSQDQQAAFLNVVNRQSFAQECTAISEVNIPFSVFKGLLTEAGITSVTTQNELIACLLQAGIVFT
jgi:hypothetical protein